MIEDARHIRSGETLRADVCIIGAGAAGVTVAHELIDSGLSVVLLVGGGRRERRSDHDLYRGQVDPAGSHEPLEQNRRRGWGGTTAWWGGRCLPLDPIDFEIRPHVPHSGWPLTYDELVPYYERANQLCEAGAFTYSVAEALPQSPSEMIRDFDGELMVSSRLERWSPPTNFGRRYEADLKRARSVRVVMHGHALRLQLSADATRVVSVDAASDRGSHFEVEADEIVLACGGLENARLLLASDTVLSNGIGNSHDNVGRFYMTHVSDVVATIQLENPVENLVFGFERDADGVYVRRRFWATGLAQQQRGIANAAAVLHRPDISDPGHGSAVFSATFLVKDVRRAVRDHGAKGAMSALRRSRQDRRPHWRIVARNALRFLPLAVQLVNNRWLARRRLPMVLGEPTGTTFECLVTTEHVPNRESRVLLGEERDAFGVRRLIVRFASGELDVDTVVGFFDLFSEQLSRTGTGVLSFDPSQLRAQVRRQLGRVNSLAHHLGTTRMADRPEDGVVDSDCRVFGVENLYVAGGSVFPTSGHANPTLTIVALAARLADHVVSLRQTHGAGSGLGG